MHFLPGDFLIPFVTIALAELLDKSQLSILLLSSRTTKYTQLFLGVMLAFVLLDGSAVLLGSYVTSLLPALMIKIIAASLFIIFGILSLRQSNKEESQHISTKNIFLTSFTMITAAEFGDKTQLAAALFATKFQPVLVLIGVLSSLALLTILTIFIGKTLTKIISRSLISKIAGIVFIVLGVLFLFV